MANCFGNFQGGRVGVVEKVAKHKVGVSAFWRVRQYAVSTATQPRVLVLHLITSFPQ